MRWSNAEGVAETTDQLGEVAAEMRRLFRGDSRRVMQQFQDRYGVLHEGPLSEQDLALHLQGRVSVACFLLDENAQCATICLDVDIPKVDIPPDASEREELKRAKFLPVVERIMQYLESDYSVSRSAILLEDTGGRGYHVWLFFQDAQPASRAVAFARDVKAHVGIDSVEVFPAAARRGKAGYSKSLVRLPLGVHQAYAGSRSTLLASADLARVSAEDAALHLRHVHYIPPSVLDTAERKTAARTVPRTRPRGEGIDRTEGTAVTALTASAQSPYLACPAVSALVSKAKQHAHLAHHERVALVLTLGRAAEWEPVLTETLRCCSDFSEEKTQYHIASLEGYHPVSCQRLQQSEYGICDGWCSEALRVVAEGGRTPTPLWLLTGEWEPTAEEAIPSDADPVLETVASIENLHLAWQQARRQASERDIFEDVQAYAAFEAHLWANLRILRAELLSKRWRHQPFRVLAVPKSADDPTNTRPVCFSGPWDAIVDLAVLNIIGPVIDSTFSGNSLGNRLARGPRAEGQVFEDWRKQNRYRELRREGFSRYSSAHYYVLADISRFYECIPHDRLMLRLAERVRDQRVLDLVQQYVEADWLAAEPSQQRARTSRAVGIPQGPALSALLANLHLDDLDIWMESRCVDFIRYVDDMALLVEGEGQAKSALADLGRALADFGLSLSDDPSKVKGPFPATDATQLTDWLRDARYELAKCASYGHLLTDTEKTEMLASLSYVAGAELAQPEERERLVRYLGFYVANTEKLEDQELQRGVYALALHTLADERPRHNATCIAVRALIKACSEFGDPAWHEVDRLVQSRSDSYFRVVVAQEARRFVQRANEGIRLHPMLQQFLEEQIASDSEIVAAAAIACVGESGSVGAGGSHLLWQRFLGESRYLRPRAGMVLAGLGAMTAASLARVTPADGDELALLLCGTARQQTQATVGKAAAAFAELTLSYRSIPPPHQG